MKSPNGTKRVSRAGASVLVLPALTLALAIAGCGGDDETTTVATGTTGSTGSTGVTGVLGQYTQDYSLPEINETCETANDAAEVYERLHLGTLVGNLAEYLSRGRIESEAIELLGVVGVVRAKSCNIYQPELKGLFGDENP